MKFYLAIVAACLLSAVVLHEAQAQGLSGVATNQTVTGENISEGDIVAVTANGFEKGTSESRVTMFGVVVTNPIISVQPRTENTIPIISSGIANVRVSGLEPVKSGDYITLSDNPGVGIKTSQSDYVLGRALADYSGSGIELIPVEINISYVDIGQLGNVPSELVKYLNQPNFFRYALAFVTGLITLFAATYAFIKFTSNGIVAIGRNPLAKGSIGASMVFSGSVAVLLALSGVGVAWLIINANVYF